MEYWRVGVVFFFFYIITPRQSKYPKGCKTLLLQQGEESNTENKNCGYVSISYSCQILFFIAFEQYAANILSEKSIN